MTRHPRFAELDRLIAEEPLKRTGRPRGAKNKMKTANPPTEIPARPYFQNGLRQREAHKKQWETRNRAEIELKRIDRREA